MNGKGRRYPRESENTLRGVPHTRDPAWPKQAKRTREEEPACSTSLLRTSIFQVRANHSPAIVIGLSFEHLLFFRTVEFGIFVVYAVKKILVVEDDPAVQRALRRLFESEDF